MLFRIPIKNSKKKKTLIRRIYYYQKESSTNEKKKKLTNLSLNLKFLIYFPGSSRETISSTPNSLESPIPLGICGPLTVFSFIVPGKFEKVSYKEQKQNLKSAIENSSQFQDGLLLDTREKGGKLS